MRQNSSAVIARSKATKQSRIHPHKAGLLRCARNDEAPFTRRGIELSRALGPCGTFCRLFGHFGASGAYAQIDEYGRRDED
jgi:hypothetical protein